MVKAKHHANISVYHRESPVECYKLNMVAGILTLFFVLSFIQNIMLLYSFYRNRRKLSPVDALIIYLICVNFFGVLVEFPIGIITNLSCKWILDEFGCDFSSSIMVYVGPSSIYTMSLISYDR